VSPDRVPFTIDRILPMPMLFEGEVRFSAQIAHTIRMSEGVVTVYVVGRLIYFAGQLAAAQRAWKAAQRIDHRLAAGLDQVGTAVAGAKAVVHDAAGKVGETVKGGVVSETLGSVTDAMSAGVDGVVSIAKAITTRLIRRK
jgi:hypothetical protein